MSSLLENKSPAYYVRKRLFGNKPAVFGLVIIFIAHLIAGLGTIIMPDKTPNVTDGAVQIQKQTPGFTATILKHRKNMEIASENFIISLYMGKESLYTIIPIDKYELKADSVIFQQVGKENVNLGIPIVECVFPLYVGPSNKINSKNGENYVYSQDSTTYVDLQENVHTISNKDLYEEFEKKCIEKRTYYLGTDKAGRDMLSRLLFGTRISLTIGFIAVIISLVLGVTLGAIGGFFGGKVDAVVNWIMTVVWSIPSIMLVIAISLALESKGIWVAFLAVGLTMWVDIARVVRGQIISVKQKSFVEAAKAFGFSNRKIIFQHILPNMLGPLIVISTSNFASAILIEAGLSFLGIGVKPPMPSWGMMINEGFSAIGTKDSWHLVLLPSLCISFTVLAFNLFGNGLRDAYDPKNH